MATYYIDPNGNNTNASAPATAPRNLSEFKTLVSGVTDTDIIEIEGDNGPLDVETTQYLTIKGTYRKNPSSTNRPLVRFVGIPGNNIELKMTGITNFSSTDFNVSGTGTGVFLFSVANNISGGVFDSLKFDFSDFTGIWKSAFKFESALFWHNITIKNNIFIKQNFTCEFSVSHSYDQPGTQGTDLIFINNTYYNFGTSNHPNIFMIENASNVEFQDNVYYCDGDPLGASFDDVIGTVKIDYNDIYNVSGAAYLGNTSPTGAHSITIDPLLTDPGADDFSLQESSPCRNTGTTTSATLDYDGVSRPQGIAFDMGALEYVEAVDHSVNFYAGANGSLTGDTSQTVSDGGDASAVTAVPDANYNFTAWSGDNTSTDNPLTLTNVTSDMDTTANFAIDTYAVNFSAGANGSLTGDTTQTVDHGSNSTAVTAVPDANYNFTAWSGDNTSTDNPLTLTNVASDMDTTANFAIDTYSVNFSAGADGSLTGDTTQTVDHGSNSTAVTAVPDTGATFTAWSGDNTSTDNPLIVTNVTADMDMTANYTLNTYTVDFSLYKKNQGDIVGETSQTVAYGGSTTAVRADPRDKYNFLLWAGGGVLSLNRTLTLTNVTSSKNVKAYFIKQFSVEKMLSGKRGGSSITLDPADGTNFSPAKFATRGMTPMDWNFPS